MRTWFGFKTKVEIATKPTWTQKEVQEALANEEASRPMKAINILIDQAILDRTTAAIDETLPDTETKFYLGGAAALAALKEELEYLTRPQP